MKWDIFLNHIILPHFRSLRCRSFSSFSSSDLYLLYSTLVPIISIIIIIISSLLFYSGSSSAVYNANSLLAVSSSSSNSQPVDFGLTIDTALTSASSSNYQKYENSTYGIRILYPSTWTINEAITPPNSRNINVVQFYSNASNPSSARFRVSIDQVNENETLELYTAETIQSYRNIPDYRDFTLISNNIGAQNLVGQRAYHIEYTFQNPTTGDVMMNFETGTIIENKVYYITYSADISEFQAYMPIVETMIDSLAINLPELTARQQPINSNIPEI